MHDKFQAAVEGTVVCFNPLNAELNPICHLLALLGSATIVVVSRLRVNVLYQYFVCYTAISNVRQLLSDSGNQTVSLSGRSFGDIMCRIVTEAVCILFRPCRRNMSLELGNGPQTSHLNPFSYIPLIIL